MLGTIKSEIRKLLTVRSTYVLLFVIFAMALFFNFYIEGYWGQSGSAAGTLQPGALREVIGNGVGMAALFISIIAILQMGHEYRHNTITYTLTANSRRTQVFLAKTLVLGAFAVVVGLLVALVSLLTYKLGLSLRDASLPPQDIEYGIHFFRVAVYSFVYGILGLLVAVLLRNLIGAIVFILIFPTTAEPLLGLLLKDKSVYLPFTTFDHILGAAITQGDMTMNRATIFSLLYIAILGVVTWVLFVRRDAN